MQTQDIYEGGLGPEVPSKVSTGRRAQRLIHNSEVHGDIAVRKDFAVFP